MQITRPLIIVGTGRCGSTVFHRLLAQHPRVMWLSGFAERYPDKPAWNRWAVTATGTPLLHPLLGEKIRPAEAYSFWDRYAYGFSEPCRDLGRADVTPRVKRQLRSAIERMLTRARDRLLVKITGWPRIGFLNGVFEDAGFVHIIRDGRAVANSLLHVNFWRGWQGPQGWRAGLLSPEDQAAWEAYDRSFVALAGIEWRIQMRAIEAARRALDPGLFLEIRYEEFCQAPQETFRRVLEFAELPRSPGFERRIESASIRDMSNRWRDDLTPEQQVVLDDLLREDLRRYGYEPSDKDQRVAEAAAAR
ncbi:MAG TPA: sulfotransferase [Gemmatimonadales bacterium]|nr:sulfotransferase [Gemmatimonadales bacterium]